MHKAYNVVTLLWVVAGEAAAMVVLLDGKVTSLAFGLTTNALFVAAGETILRSGHRAAGGCARCPQDDRRPPAKSRTSSPVQSGRAGARGLTRRCSPSASR